MNRRTCLSLAFMFLALTGWLRAQDEMPSQASDDMFRKGYDVPVNIPHGTWDFDEWPGVNHPVMYKQNYMYNSIPNEKVKIDYFLSAFDRDDHEGYLKTPAQLKERGFVDITTVLRAGKNRTIVGIFTHPDDEVLLAGGLIAWAARNGMNVRIYLVSNGANGDGGTSPDPSERLGGYNSFGVMPNGDVVITTDRTGEKKLDIIASYTIELGTTIQVLPIDITVDGKRIVQIGEVPGLDFGKTFGPGTDFRNELRARLAALLEQEQPGFVFTHGTDGEYANPLHKIVHDLTVEVANDYADRHPVAVFTCFPEYNVSDRITHFLDMDANDRQARDAKWNAVKKISFLYVEGTDYDKPWDPNDKLMDGAFVKDYGYGAESAEPPRYEFFKTVEPAAK